MARYIDADALIEKLSTRIILGMPEYNVGIAEAIKTVKETPTEKGLWIAHEVACLLAEVVGDDCACNVNDNDEWLPLVCDFGETNSCPYPGGVACWEQWLAHRKEKPNV